MDLVTSNFRNCQQSVDVVRIQLPIEIEFQTIVLYTQEILGFLGVVSNDSEAFISLLVNNCGPCENLEISVVRNGETVPSGSCHIGAVIEDQTVINLFARLQR